MTNPTTHRQVPAIQRYKIGYHSDEWGVRSLSPTGIYDDAGPWVRYEDHAAELRRQHARIAELESELEAVGAGGVQALSAAPAGWKLVPVEPTNDMQKAAGEWAAKGFDWPKAVYRAMLAASPPAKQQAAPKAAPAQQEWRLVLPGGKYTDKWESARIGDYNRGWNDYRKTAIAALNSVVWPARTSGSWVGASTWLRNNYQDYPNIASLCDAMLEAAPQQEVQKPVAHVLVPYYTVEEVFDASLTPQPAPAQAAPAAVAGPSRQFTDGTRSLRQDCISAIRDFASSRPEDDEDWESWFEAAFGLCESRLSTIFDEHAAAPTTQPAEQFQSRVQPWMMECFGPVIAADRTERNHRFLEEALELVQATGCTQSEAHQLVDYVFGRPVGDPLQEVGGVMVTLAALCLASGLDMHDAGEVELARISAPELVVKIRAKQAAKPKHSPLPQSPTPQADSQPAPVPDMAVMQLAESVGLIGPASRTHDLHAAIQRFHDLICANATIKAAQMAAEAISEAAPQPSPAAQGDALSDEAVRVPLDSLHADAAYLIGRLREGSMPYARVIEIIRERIDAAKAAIRARAAQGDALDAARYRWLRENWSTMGSTYHDDKMQLYVGRPKYTNITPVDIDVAIDAARAAQEGKSHG